MGEATALCKLGARYDNSVIGRFTQPVPLGVNPSPIHCAMLERMGYRIPFVRYAAISLPFTLAADVSVHPPLQPF